MRKTLLARSKRGVTIKDLTAFVNTAGVCLAQYTCYYEEAFLVLSRRPDAIVVRCVG